MRKFSILIILSIFFIQITAEEWEISFHKKSQIIYEGKALRTYKVFNAQKSSKVEVLVYKNNTYKKYVLDKNNSKEFRGQKIKIKSYYTGMLWRNDAHGTYTRIKSTISSSSSSSDKVDKETSENHLILPPNVKLKRGSLYVGSKYMASNIQKVAAMPKIVAFTTGNNSSMYVAEKNNNWSKTRIASRVQKIAVAPGIVAFIGGNSTSVYVAERSNNWSKKHIASHVQKIAVAPGIVAFIGGNSTSVYVAEKSNHWSTKYIASRIQKIAVISGMVAFIGGNNSSVYIAKSPHWTKKYIVSNVKGIEARNDKIYYLKSARWNKIWP